MQVLTTVLQKVKSVWPRSAELFLAAAAATEGDVGLCVAVCADNVVNINVLVMLIILCRCPVLSHGLS